MPERGSEPSVPPAAMLNEALAALNQCVWLFLPETRKYLYTSAPLLALLGLDPATPALNADRWVEMIHPEDREALLQALSELRTDGAAIVIEHRIRRPKGGECWVQGTIRQYTGADGQLIQAGSLIDISGRKAAEQRLRSSEQRFENIYQHLSEAVILSRPDGAILMANPAAERLFGYREAELIAGGRALILDEQDSEFQAHHARSCAGDRATNVLSFRCRDGSRFTGEAASVPFELETGETQLASLIRDLSRERAYAETTRQLYEISEAMPGAIYQFRMAPDGSVSFPFLSPSAERQWGYTAERLNSLPEGFLGIVHPDDRGALLASTVASGRELSPWLMKFRGWDLLQQRYRWIRGHTIPSRQPDGSTLWNGTLLDIDEAERNLQDLESQRRQLQAILDSIGEGISVLDREGHLVLNNAYGQRLLGMGATEVPSGQWPSIYGIYLPDGVTPCPPDELPSRRALQGEAVRNCELWLHTPSGQRSYLLLTASPLRDDQGEIVGAVGVYRDITALYLAEQQVRQTSERMKYLLERFNLGFMTLTRDWQVSFFNRAAWELSGRVPPGKLVSCSFWETFADAERLGLRFRAEYERAVREDASVHFAEYYPPLDTWFEVNAYPYQGELDLFFEDVTYTRRHQALSELEKELLASELQADRELTGLIGNALAGLERIFAYRRFVLLRACGWGLELPSLLASQDLALARLALPAGIEAWLSGIEGRRWLAGEAGGWLDELLALTGCGAVRPVALRGHDGALKAVLLVLYHRGDWEAHAREAEFLAAVGMLLRNVLETWLAVWRLRESHQRYELAGRATRDAIWDWNLSDDDVTITASLQEAFGYVPPAAASSLAWWYGLIHPEDLAAVSESLRLHLARGDQYWQAEYRFRHADGSWREVLDRGFTLFDAAGKAVRMIGAIQDITTIKAHERRILAQNERLIAITWQQSHEVRRPLANLLGLLDLIEMDACTSDKLGLLRQEAEALDKVIQRIVTQSQDALAADAGARGSGCQD